VGWDYKVTKTVPLNIYKITCSANKLENNKLYDESDPTSNFH